MSGGVADQIGAVLRRRFGFEISTIRPVAGGDINDAFRAETSDGPLFVKTRADAPAGSFAEEAAGLHWLRVPGGLAVPEVVGVHDPQRADEALRFLALRWIERGCGGTDADELLGRGLARVHAAGASGFGAGPGGVHTPQLMGPIKLPNAPCDTFAEFYGERRILPLTELAARRGALTAAEVQLMHHLAARLPELAGPPEPPSRTHGDLWSGNVLVDGHGQPYLIDPVAHGGHREVDLATLRVFGGPSQRCFDAYAEVHPLADGHEDRVALWQLGIILLHVALFGGAYAQQAVGLARRYV